MCGSNSQYRIQRREEFVALFEDRERLMPLPRELPLAEKLRTQART